MQQRVSVLGGAPCISFSNLISLRQEHCLPRLMLRYDVITTFLSGSWNSDYGIFPVYSSGDGDSPESDECEAPGCPGWPGDCSFGSGGEEFKAKHVDQSMERKREEQ